ncbi:MAG: hypothetical protein IIZ47_06625 [Erysipelotrichaceae bacterium]|nr:hypothetical protein [Erysipelotrichaceae bacterium]
MEKIKEFITGLYKEHLFTCIGCFFFLFALLVFLAHKVHPHFIIYPMIALGVIALLIGFICFGILAAVIIPLAYLPAAIILWFALNLMELIPMVVVGALVILGILCIIIQKNQD